MDKHSILVVDDQPSVCQSVAAILKGTYKVFPFTSGKDALDYLAENQVSLVLLDYEMPGMTGYEVLLSIRTNRSTKDTPVVFLTAETNERMKQEMIGRGANDYLTKPIVPGDLQACIKKYL